MVVQFIHHLSRPIYMLFMKLLISSSSSTITNIDFYAVVNAFSSIQYSSLSANQNTFEYE